MKLYKTTIVVWSDFHPGDMDMSDLVRDGESGESIVSESPTIEVTSVDAVPQGVLEFMCPNHEEQ